MSIAHALFELLARSALLALAKSSSRPAIGDPMATVGHSGETTTHVIRGDPG